MRQDIKTSVIIPVYNTEKYLQECVESVLAQTQKEIEIILVDDGSTDGSAKIIQYYEKNYPCVRAVYQDNQKLGAARNTGVKIASGKYIYFLDSDDFVVKDLLESCYMVSEEKKLDFVMIDSMTLVEGEPAEFRTGSANEQYDRSEMGITDKIYAGAKYWNEFFGCQGVYANAYLHYINADFLRRNKLYFEPGIFYEDMEWIPRMYACADRIAYLPKKLYIRRIHGNSIMTVQYNDLHMKSCVFVCEKAIQMFLCESDDRSQILFQDIFKAMIWRFRDIIKYYCSEKKEENKRKELVAFYQYLSSVYESIESKMFQVEILLTAEIICENISAYDGKEWDGGMPLEDYKWQLVAKDIQRLSLDKSEKIIGIYGTGREWNRFFSVYRKNMGEISATVFFIDTDKKSGEFYQGYPVYNVRDLENLQYDSIIVASNRYKDAMLKIGRAHV